MQTMQKNVRFKRNDGCKAIHTEKKIGSPDAYGVWKHASDPPPIIWSLDKPPKQWIYETFGACEATSINTNN